MPEPENNSHLFCQNCATFYPSLQFFRTCPTCGSRLCYECTLEHRKWSRELRVTDKMVNRENRINGYVTDGLGLLFDDPKPLPAPTTTTKTGKRNEKISLEYFFD